VFIRLVTNSSRLVRWGFITICYNNNILYTNARWTSIRFEELIATYGCCGRIKRIAKEQYKCSCGGIYIGATGADKLSAK
jgi:hypothetical protein